MRKAIFVSVMLTLLPSAALASAYAALNAGILSHTDERWDDAIQYFTTALADPALPKASRVVAYYDRGDAYFQQNKLDLAFRDVTAAISLDPHYRDAFVLRSIIYAYAGRYLDAVASDTALLAFAPQVYDAYTERAIHYLSADRLDDALNDANSFIALEPDSYFGYEIRSSIYMTRGDVKSALNDAEKSIDENDKSAPAQFERAAAEFALGDFGRTESAIAEWVKLDPGVTSYGALWTALARAARNKDASGAVDNGLESNASSWPAPILGFYAGKLSEQQLDLSIEKDAKQKKETCEANFYAGEWLLLHNQASGKVRLALAANQCPMEFVERQEAAIALARSP